MIKSITLYCDWFNRYCSVLYYHWIIIIKHGTKVTDLIPLGHYKISWTALKVSKTDFLWLGFHWISPLWASWLSRFHCRLRLMVLTFVAPLRQNLVISRWGQLILFHLSRLLIVNFIFSTRSRHLLSSIMSLVSCIFASLLLLC